MADNNDTFPTITPQPAPRASQQVPLSVQTLIETRLTNEKNSVFVAYLLLLFLGAIGVHLFYLGRTKQGLLYLVTALVGFAFPPLWIIPSLGCLIDLFLIPSYVRKNTDEKRRQMFLAYERTGRVD